MRRIIIYIFLFTLHYAVIAQNGWTWTEKKKMPFAVSNNGTAAATVNDTTYVYSFCGLDSTKLKTGIHNKGFRYNTESDLWDTIPNLPDSLNGVIALSATTIKNKIYIIGGYHVASDNSEISSYEVFMFDPDSNKYYKKTSIPVAIDDQVSAAYKDSLLYIITGWTSDLNPDENTNVVQIYNPSNDSWSSGTSTPNNSSYEAFGASGEIVGDTIYYAGGAINGSFSLTNKFRKGVIDPIDPTQIVWSIDTSNVGDKLYRASCVSINYKLFWIGGAATPYNYDGLAYGSGTGVNPTNRILEWIPETRKFYENFPTTFEIMDLRNIAKISPTQYVIAGGMLANQVVSNKTFLLEYDTSYQHPVDPDTVGLQELLASESFKISPNPNTGLFAIKLIGENLKFDISEVIIYSSLGKKVYENKIKDSINANYNLDLEPGLYFVTLRNSNSIPVTKKMIVN